jgi:hypothetical protein
MKTAHLQGIFLKIVHSSYVVLTHKLTWTFKEAVAFFKLILKYKILWHCLRGLWIVGMTGELGRGRSNKKDC